MALGNLNRIECAFAEAAVDQTLWERALDVATCETGSFGAVLLPVTGVAIPNTPTTESLHKVSEHYFRDEFHLRDQRHAGVPVFMKTGIMDDSDCIDLDLMKRHSYYQEFLASHGLRWFAGVKVACRDEVWCLSIQRRIEQGPFPSEDKLRLASLSRNLSTSAALAQAFAASAVNGALNAFELNNMAIALVNRHGDVYRVNEAAETLLKGDVRICARKILSSNAEASASLSRAISRLLWQPTGASLAAPVALPRVNKSPLIAYPARLSAVAANALSDCQAIVIFLDPDERRGASEALLQSAFSLTPTEAKLASRIGTGASLDDISNELQITKQTGRTHLKHIFGKMGIGRQSELVAFLNAMSRHQGGARQRRP
jgi:DNA-binding CsgD family transcriptional regulator